jgi:thiol-disulfide isomerase/thioredoxin
MKLDRIAASMFATFLLAIGPTSHARDALQSLSRADDWLNSDGLSAEQLKGKVVLVDFWTYTCVNWLRTLPYLRAWQEKYREQGLVVIGVHSPEFEFEKNVDYVRSAAQRLHVDYPIAVDSQHAIWRAYDNQYWPAAYLVDRKGRVQFHHFGEGNYADIERAIQRLLADDAHRDVPSGVVAVDPQGAEVAADWDNLQSPENYLGYQRTSGFSSPEDIRRVKPSAYSVPRKLRLNSWALAGDWTLMGDLIRLARPGGRIAYRFHARDVNLVMRPAATRQSVRFRVLIDGKPPGAAHGFDVDTDGNGILREPRLYQLIRQPGRIEDRQFEIEFLDDGVEAYSFTFG